MDMLNVYRCRDGGYLLSPESAQVAMRKRHMYGPLEAVGSISEEALDDEVRESVRRQVADRLFALISGMELWGLARSKPQRELRGV